MLKKKPKKQVSPKSQWLNLVRYCLMDQCRLWNGMVTLLHTVIQGPRFPPSGGSPSSTALESFA